MTFTPKPNFSGTVAITYVVNDNTGAVSSPGNITVTVNPVNDNPVAVADNISTGEDLGITFNPTSNDTDIDGTIDATTLDLDPGTSGVQRTMSTPQGIWTTDVGGNLTFTPKNNYNGPASLNYTVKDNSGATSNAVTVSVTVGPVNDEPVLVDKALTVTQGRGATDNLLVGAIDPDGTPLVINTTPISDLRMAQLQLKPTVLISTWLIRLIRVQMRSLLRSAILAFRCLRCVLPLRSRSTWWSIKVQS